MPAASGKWEKRHITLLNDKWLTIHCSMHSDEHEATELEFIVIKNLVQKAWFSKVSVLPCQKMLESVTHGPAWILQAEGRVQELN